MVKCKKVFFNHQKKDEMVISQFLFNIVLEILHKTMKKYIYIFSWNLILASTTLNARGGIILGDIINVFI